MSVFAGRTLIIATRHSKESVIAPLMEQGLGVTCVVPEELDTDALGTFSGEVVRANDPLTTARDKCKMALDNFGGDLVLASEGSFGPHPSLFFVPADDELLVLIDQKNGIEIVARELSTDTNFSAKEITSEKELLAFAAKAGFPEHALILRRSKEDYTDIHKGINDRERLVQVYRQLLTNGSVYVETDMRAMYNPTRMSVIRKAAEKLLEKARSLCPVCTTPGFGITEAIPGLPCNWCGQPTRSTLALVYTCRQCGFAKEDRYPHQKQHADPMYCDYCNP